jgi:hypothetical protein
MSADRWEKAADREGWALPGAARRFHYFVQSRSLCNRWMFTGHLEPDTGNRTAQPGPEDCVPCWRKRNRMLAP